MGIKKSVNDVAIAAAARSGSSHYNCYRGYQYNRSVDACWLGYSG